ncbi:Putative ATP:guanido phosphotransferase SAV0524,ATP:guanido phosphotransferase,Arginine kinase,ATP:guanido phosphotransferase, C-terminal catalytic domain [Chlamydia serpentis]|uniref:ATP:guanido phosphotransferase SAV0524,ATP:guanido phosphotransferase,Arginine kinase,ATP:guanido phosphotransferase, C-terminal catalytic domain n=1 Tax=Chlamydia serpentis TaxID=1967782 RepID=A0A2R8FBL2_9CHLA|nr:protein arginine kinase [Chlamydia serpentis]SPN73819.1 Putative ATP:guanido phosphotransferase SAV0524,ATP:guanido phosphotransferase,Arginine kinase,ATP:guanido phosphotransferase, C-terminal catalytic domain [Chlamydia serpentis]
MTLPNDLLENLVKRKENGQTNKVWPATTFSLSRNLSVSKFLPSLSREQKLEILQFITSHFNNIEGFGEFIVLPLKDIPLWQKEFLFEHFLLPYDVTGNPEGEALIVSRSGDFLAAINFQDHLIIHTIDFQGNVEKTLDQLVHLDSCLHNKLSFAFSSEFGFLTTNPKNCGTGLKTQCFLHVPALLYCQEFMDLLDAEAELVTSSLLPGTAGFPGNIVVLSNRCSLGLTEEQLLSSLRIAASKVSVAEVAAKKRLSEENSCSLKNHSLRALGLLTHSCQLELKETLDALSWIQLGIDLGWIKTSQSHPIWNPLFWQTRRAHLALQQPEASRNLQKDTISYLRANVLKELTKDLSTNGF